MNYLIFSIKKTLYFHFEQLSHRMLFCTNGSIFKIISIYKIFHLNDINFNVRLNKLSLIINIAAIYLNHKLRVCNSLFYHA